MTVSAAGAGQQQGRAGWIHNEFRRAKERAESLPSWARPVVTSPAPSPVPPARDSGRDEAREAARDAIGQLLSEWTASQRWWVKASEADRESYREDADAVLDLPAVRRLLDGAR